jgi:hypothetical protein
MSFFNEFFQKKTQKINFLKINVFKMQQIVSLNN